MAEPEERTEQAIKGRQVTEIHGNYNEFERGQPASSLCSSFSMMGQTSMCSGLRPTTLER
jgi:hypothetical protein